MNYSAQRPTQRTAANCSCQRSMPERNTTPSPSCSSSLQNLSRAQLMQYINEVSFAVNDLLLYLDTHPDDEKAMAFYRENAEKRTTALRQYAMLYGPLTVDTALDSASRSWEWVQQPWPWEGGCY
ncbi:MAG: spore coat protein CotJB [Lachnospiraceae bacterium]|nr:spore coat protein CotJB [Lachnospiraceae bacterium]